MCVVTRRVRPIDDLIRFVLSPTGEPVPDLKRKLPGRGLWVSASHKAVAEAAKRNLFARGFKKNVKVSAQIADETDKLMLRGVTDALAMVAKAGQVVSGFTKVEDALRRNAAEILLHATNGAADGIRKLDGIVRQNAAFDDETDQIPIITLLSSDELDLALGRSNVIHAAVLTGPAGKTFLSRSQTLVRYRMADADINASAKPSKTHASPDTVPPDDDFAD
jgi:predicted RNA-binding protein YlxR (DUF448 family)